VEYRVDSEPTNGSVAVRTFVRLTPRELTSVFVAGDVLLHLPTDGLAEAAAERPIPRTSMFLSELAELREGYLRVFADQASADAYAAEVREQLEGVAAEMRAT
jgi:hypothetical protein